MTKGAAWLAVAIVGLTLLACSRDGGSSAGDKAARERAASVTVSGDDRIAGSLTWDQPAVVLTPEGRVAALEQAAHALAAGKLYEDAGSAIPLYLAVLRQAPDEPQAKAGLQQALGALLVNGERDLAGADGDMEALRAAHRVAAVARTVAPQQARVQAFLRKVDLADQAWELNRQAEQDLRAGRYGESGRGGALQKLRAVLQLQPGQARARQGLAAVESGLIRRAEDTARKGDFAGAQRWLVLAERVRHGKSTIADAGARIAMIRTARISDLHDQGMRALLQPAGVPTARVALAEMMRIADPGNGDVAELRQRIDDVTHYGLFRPGQHFTDALKSGARGPEMVVVPHGGFRMGAGDEEEDATDFEKPAHYVRIARGFAMSRNEVTVDQFRDFVRASGYRSTADRHGHAQVYDERSGTFMRRRDVDWQSAYDGTRANGALPVLFVSQRDAQAYVEWLAAQSGMHYRLPSEAEFEYVLRAGGTGRYPWGNAAPPAAAGNVNGGKDTSPGGRHWSNGFAGYGDGFWGPAPVGSYRPNAYGLHDLAGNVGEWVADCWHDSYRRAPDDGAAWVNPGCGTGVVRGGSWASTPVQTRSAWRAPLDAEATNARIGFRVVRDI
jgi:formylglycine-generating enzyme required for sulfatase activity